MWDDEEDLCVTLFELFSELFVLFGSGFNYLRKMQQLVTLLAVQEVRQTLAPAVFKFYKDLD